jgi:Zn-dependent alcohol dehydrogenase
MKAAVLKQLNSPLEICEVELSELKTGQVLVKVIVSGICGSQLQEIQGNKGNAKFLPHLLGHEGCGIVESIGPGVANVKKGDKVVMHWRPGAGIESEFPIYFLDKKQISSGKVTTLSEFAIVSENRLTSIPSDTPPEFAALLGCSLSTALGIIDRETGIKFGESVAIIGCGGVGLNLLQGAKLKGASPIVAIEKNSTKKNLCLNLGADQFHESISEIDNKISTIIDTTGNPNVISKAFSKLAPSGNLILVGQPKPGESIKINDALSFFDGSGLSIKASQGGDTVPQLDIPRYLKLFYNGQLDVDSLVTDRFNLSEINEALNILETGLSGRIMISLE